MKIALPAGVAAARDDHHVSSTTARLDQRTRVLKHGDSFAVFDRRGNVEAPAGNEYGLFHQDTRHLSRLVVRVGAPGQPTRPLLLLSSAIKNDNAILSADLTNPDLQLPDGVVLPQGELHAWRAQVLWRGALCDRLRIHHYGEGIARFTLEIEVGADFADIFEARGMTRERRGALTEPRVEQSMLVLGYEGLDGRKRRTRVAFDPPPQSLSARSACYEIELKPHDAVTLRWTVACECDASAEPAATAKQDGIGVPWYEDAAQRIGTELQAARAAQPRLQTSNTLFDEWLGRSLADLRLLTTETPSGRYPYAGVPWFSTPFGRDGLITALQCLWFAPAMARGVLDFLAAKQATHENPEQDAQPGKILHETRGGEMAALGEVPFGRYYGSVDSTPLFVMLAGAYYRRTGDLAVVRRLWPHVERALGWIEGPGDADGDGFVEYARRSTRGLQQQGWKDSHDSVFHADGAPADGPIALCEVQGYVYAALRGAGELARALGHEARAARLEDRARQLAEHFEAAFWCEELQTYALALDGRKRPCRVRTSNAGQCLFTGIASHERACRTARTLMSESGWSGWGVRTLASVERRYNPMAYHNGTVWPHDNSIVAAGLGRYGLRDEAGRILGGLFDASLYFDLYRLPELFCGFTRRADETPTLYPQACAPQAWAAASPLLCLQACLGLEVDGVAGRVSLSSPCLPPFLEQVRIQGLQLEQGSIDLAVTRHDGDVGVRLLRRDGNVDLLVRM